MQHFLVSHFTAKMTKAQNSQKLRKTTIQFLFHVCLSWASVSHCLSCSVIIIKTANFFALKLFCVYFNERICINDGISLHLSPPRFSTDLLAAQKPHSDFHNLALHKQEKGHKRVTMWLQFIYLPIQQTQMKCYQIETQK